MHSFRAIRIFPMRHFLCNYQIFRKVEVPRGCSLDKETASFSFTYNSWQLLELTTTEIYIRKRGW